MKHLVSLVIVIAALCVQLGACFNFLERMKCKFYECCEAPYLRRNYTILEDKLSRHIYGQPLVGKTLITALRGHFELSNPRKALVLSFHGPTGVGKNYVSHFVAESLFAKGIKSRYFKLFVATKDFPHNDKINEYKDKIKQVIESTVKECHSSLFVFDETDKIPVGLLDLIKAYIDYNHEVEGVDFRRSVFIFLSNSASRSITELTQRQLDMNVPREQFDLKKFQIVIQNTVYSTKEKDNKGLFHATIIESYLIDFYIPFLPLEKRHVRQCVSDELKKYQFAKKPSLLINDDIDEIVEEMAYEQVGLSRFSTSGCKRVPNLVRNLIVQKNYELKDEL